MAVIRAKGKPVKAVPDGQTKECSNCHSDGCRNCDGYGYFVFSGGKEFTVTDLPM